MWREIDRKGMEAFDCQGCGQRISGSQVKYHHQGSEFCYDCANGEQKGSDDFPGIHVKNRGNLDAIDVLRGKGTGVPLCSAAKAEAYKESINAHRAEVISDRRGNRFSNKDNAPQVAGRIPAELFHDPNGPFGNEPGDKNIEKKLSDLGLRY